MTNCSYIFIENIFVLIKQVPSLHNLEIDKRIGTLIREGVENIINPDDLYGLELGLSLKEQYGGEITVMTMGPPQAEFALRECLAMGADKAILLKDADFKNSDTFATSNILAAAIRKIGDYSIIFCGNSSFDTGTSQVGPELAAILNVPAFLHVKFVVI